MHIPNRLTTILSVLIGALVLSLLLGPAGIASAAATGNAGLTTSNDGSLAIQLLALGAALLIVIGAAFAVRRYRR